MGLLQPLYGCLQQLERQLANQILGGGIKSTGIIFLQSYINEN